MRFRKRIWAWAFVLAAAISRSATAGPPFITDDPEPTDTGHFENYLYTQGTRAAGQVSGTAVGAALNYGPFPDTQLTLAIPFGFAPGRDGSARFGLAPIQFGVKYRFVEEDDSGWRPQIAVFPDIQFAVGNAPGTEATTAFFPLWAQKTFGAWTTFGGGGFNVNPGVGKRDFWSYGWAVLRPVSDRLQLGGEIFGQTRDALAGRSSTGAGLGALYDFNDTWHVVGSVNTGIVDRRRSNEYSYFVALKWTR